MRSDSAFDDLLLQLPLRFRGSVHLTLSLRFLHFPCYRPFHLTLSFRFLCWFSALLLCVFLAKAMTPTTTALIWTSRHNASFVNSLSLSHASSLVICSCVMPEQHVVQSFYSKSAVLVNSKSIMSTATRRKTNPKTISAQRSAEWSRA